MTVANLYDAGKKYISENKKEVLFVTLLLLICAVAHGWNMLRFPYIENDEATYISQASSFINHGKLAPYTYYYDHVPGGWIFMSLWLALTVKIPIISSSLVSGRIFMLLIHVASALLLYLAAKKLARSKHAAYVAVLIYSLSPLVIYYQRRILLDSIMLFWVLLSVTLILYANNKLKYYLASAFCFGLALLTKESALPFLPPLLYLVYSSSDKKHRKHAVAQWFGVFAVTVLVYVLYAYLKGELFPAHTLLGGDKDHVSMLGTLKDQSSRGTFHWFWDRNGDFYSSVGEWLRRDAVFVVAGLASLCIGLLLAIRNKAFRFPVFISLMTLIFLARGKLVIGFYVIPLLPFLAINIAMIYGLIDKRLKNRTAKILMLATVLVFVGAYSITKNTKLYLNDETTNQHAAEQWINDNVPRASYIAVDNYAYPYLQDEGGHKNADYVFKIQYDKEISAKIDNDWKNIDYILLTHEVVKQIKLGSLPIIKEALEHSTLEASFRKDTTSYIDLEEYISTNGDWADIYKVKSDEDIILQDSWAAYKENNVESYGQVVDHSQNITTSEGQAYGMLRALAAGDKSSFDGIYAWTRDHMQHRDKDKLFSWKWHVVDGQWKQADANTATDADEDIAAALIKANAKWKDTAYLADAKVILNDMWANEIITVNNRYYVNSSAAPYIAGSNVVLNPSYVDPAAYKIFAAVDSAHPWNTLVDHSYEFLSQVQNKESGFVPDWAEINANGDIVGLSTPNFSAKYGYDAFRTGIRVSDDITDPRAKSFITPAAAFYKNAWAENKFIHAVYNVDGTPAVQYDDITQYASAVTLLHALDDTKTANDIYHKKIEKVYKNGTWGDVKNYYNQNWASFTIERLKKK